MKDSITTNHEKAVELSNRYENTDISTGVMDFDINLKVSMAND